MNENKVDIFLKMTESLSRYRRAEIKDENTSKNLIEKLYVDPLENDLILKTMLKNNTTLLIGRKGTGKSTIINRFQHEIRKIDNKLSLYVDVKALFEQSKKSSFHANNSEFRLTEEDIERLNLYKDFIKKVIDEVKKEIKNNIFTSHLLTVLGKKGLSQKTFEIRIDKLFDNIQRANFTDITSTKISSKINSSRDENINKGSATGELTSTTQGISTSLSEEKHRENKSVEEFTQILGRYFNIIDFMNQLKELLSLVGIDNVFICLDDMSEIDKQSMEIFTEFIVAPLNNLSDEYFKFKISLYPGRDYLPSIDRQKVKTYSLDYYDLYSVGSVEKVEESAIKYTKRLIEKRFKYYFGNDVLMGNYFDLSSHTMDYYYKLLFQISSNVPRIVGKILELALIKTNSLEKKITKKVLQESAKQHYVDDIEYILTKSEYIEYKSYDEAFEQYHLLELLNLIISKAKDNKKKIGNSGAKIFEPYTTNTAPSNYLFVVEEMENILKTLEFNFFITKYSKQKDKDGKDVSIFSLNYGLCIDNNIIFDEKSDRKFRIERVFDFNKLINEWMNNSKELICINCSTRYPIEQKDVFIKFNMNCTNCQGEVKLLPVMDEQIKEHFDAIKKLPRKEYEILIILKRKSNLRANELGAELDRAYQSINHSIGRNGKIKNLNYIDRHKENNIPYFSITDLGREFLNG